MFKQITNFDAGAFLIKLREIQREHKATIGGRFTWDEGRRGAIKTMAHDTSCLIDGFNGQSYSKALKTLLEKFEKLSARNDVKIPEEHRPDIARHLLQELTENAKAFGSEKNPDNLVALTLYQGADFIGAQSNGKYESIKKSSWMFKRAATSYPMAPNAYLENVITAVDRLMKDNSYKKLHGTPWIIQFAAASHSSNPDSFLDKVVSDITRLEKDERYASLWETASILKRAAVDYSPDPDAFLDKVMSDVYSLENDERYEALRQVSSIFKHAAVSYTSNPESFLDKVIENIDRLMKDERYEILHDMPSIIKRAAEYSSKDPEAFLDLAMNDDEDVEQSCSNEAVIEQDLAGPSAE